MRKVIIQGSARSEGNTNKIVKLFQDEHDFDFIDLKDYQIGQFDYNFKNRKDDFIPLITTIVEYDFILFVTPVYWYAMSGIMKTFFDRITDCLKMEKEIGRRLRGKCMAAVSCGSEKKAITGFFIPFQLSAEYLGMKYLGSLHTWLGNEEPNGIIRDNVKKFLHQTMRHADNSKP